MNCMEEKGVLLVEHNPDDVLLILRALKKNGVKNEVIVARDGVEASTTSSARAFTPGGILQ